MSSEAFACVAPFCDAHALVSACAASAPTAASPSPRCTWHIIAPTCCMRSNHKLSSYTPATANHLHPQDTCMMYSVRDFPALMYFESTELYEADPVPYRGDMSVQGPRVQSGWASL